MQEKSPTQEHPIANDAEHASRASTGEAASGNSVASTLQETLLQTLTRENEHLRKSMQLILGVIEGVEQRCMAADGPVTPTCDEITDAELRVIYELAKVA